MSNTMLKSAYRPSAPTDIFRTYGEYLPQSKKEDKEDIEKDREFFEKRGIKIIGYGTASDVVG